MTYAVISQSIVINFILWDGVSPYNPGDGMTLVPLNGRPCDIGWTYDGTQFVPPAE
jgi:hypothetical protein